MNICSFDKTSRPLRAALVVAVLAISLLLSCGRTTPTYSVALEFATGHTASSSDNTDVGFDETDCIVLRCASLDLDGQGIVVTTSRSKGMKAISLVFIRPIEAGNPEDVVRIASAPIVGKEYEYDMTQAVFYTITRSSAEMAIGDSGIPYLSWQSGASNSSEKFPCCE